MKFKFQHPQVFTYYLYILTMAASVLQCKAEYLQQTLWLTKAYKIYYLSLYSESFADP